MRDVRVRWAAGPFAQDIEIASHRLRADEETSNGGTDAGAAPHELLLSALGACTAMTLRAYASRKGWPVTDVQVRLQGAAGPTGFEIARDITINGDLDADQRQRLLEIAEKCPVHKTLMGDITIRTTQTA